jgi:hypothetical protein
LVIPGGLLALIREKTALLFWDILDSKPVWLSGRSLKLKITANSTYWKAKLRVRWAGRWGEGFGMRKRWDFDSAGIFGDRFREIHSTHEKSPQFRLVLAKGEDQDQARSRKITNYRSLFLRSRIIKVFR